MATVTRPQTTQPIPHVTTPAVPVSPSSSPAEPQHSLWGDRIACTVLLTCLLFMAALLTFDILAGIFR
jgi:hypothetical protein